MAGDDIKPYPLGMKIGALSSDIKNLREEFEKNMKSLNGNIKGMATQINTLSQTVAKLEQARADDIRFSNISSGMKVAILGALVSGALGFVGVVILAI